jgi:hypothetical protein
MLRRGKLTRDRWSIARLPSHVCGIVET